jgi:hypothetical protein
VNSYTEDERALGLEECACEPYDNDAPCVSCGERVKNMDHVHFKGQLFHEWCLLIAALKQCAAARSTQEGEKDAN